VAIAIVFLLVCAVTLNPGFAEQIAHDVFFSLTLAGCAMVLLSVRPWRQFVLAVGAGLALCSLQMLVLKTPVRASTAVGFLGLGSLFVLVVARIRSSGENRQLLQDATLPPLLLVLLGYFGSGPLEMTIRLHPKTLDWFLYSFDQSLGAQLSFKAGQIVFSSGLLTRAVVGMYYLLPLAIMFTYARQLVHNRNLAMAAFLAFVIAGPLGVVFYNLVPAGGPLNLFGSSYPFDPLTTEQLRQLPIHAVTIGGQRNAFPSLHLGWALLTWWYSEGLSRWARVASFFFLVGTVIATLGLGEHYFIDLVTAFPFALMIHAVCTLNVPSSNARRAIPLVAGVAMMVGWMVLLRWGLPLFWINPVVPWSITAGTIWLTLYLQARLRPLLLTHEAAGVTDLALRQSTTASIGK
jgi:PAP2 superfamily